MKIFNRKTGLFTDHYELTMAQAFFLSGKKDLTASFDYFFRSSPFKGSYVIFAGLDDFLDLLNDYEFDKKDCEFLLKAGFHKDFVNYLEEFRFKGNIYAPHEGEIVFPIEPVMRVEGNIIEAQLIETLLLNTINFESLIATKASRVKFSAGDKRIVDFGLRRAQGIGGIQASKAAVIGGVDSTSNLLAAYLNDIDSTGTLAHSWIQSFDDELEAFRAFSLAFPKKCVLLVDTYDTLKKGVPNSILVAKEMEQRGEKMLGIRLDSGDLAYLSKRARKMLDQAGLDYVKIIASNQLDEYVIRSLKEQKAPIDVFGVGTSMVTGRPDAALDGVYKLVESNGKPRLKISEDIEKMILPGKKKIIRLLDEDDKFYADAVALEDEKYFERIYHPFRPEKSTEISKYKQELLLHQAIRKGKVSIEKKTLSFISEYSKNRFHQLPDEHKRFEFPHIYKVGISQKLLDLRTQLVHDIKQKV
jgi:nicotinate phosphoribosyltransferase